MSRDWDKIPGVLAAADGAPVDKPCSYETRGRTTFVGGATVNPPPDAGRDHANHVGGVVAMDFNRRGTATEDVVTARRAWFLLDGGFLAVVANATSTAGRGTGGMTLALEQSRLVGAVETGVLGTQQDPATVPTGSSAWPITPPPTPRARAHAHARPGVAVGAGPLGAGAGAGGRWVTHRGITYAALAVSRAGAPMPTLRATLGDQAGSWHRISTSESAAKVTLPIFKLWLDLAPAAATHTAPVRQQRRQDTAGVSAAHAGLEDSVSAAYAVLPGVAGTDSGAASKKSGNTFRVRIFLDSVRRSGTARAEGPHGAHARGAKRNRIGCSRAHGFVYRPL